MRWHRLTVFGLVVATISILIAGCATLAPKRNVIGNRFESTHPNLTVDVSEAFEYLGSVKHHEVTENFDGASIDQFYRNFVFAMTNEDVIERFLSIEYYKVSTYFSIDQLFKQSYMYEAGRTEHAGKTFEYYISLMYPSRKWHVSRFIMDEGYKKTCGLISEHMKVMGPNGDTIVKLQYYERLEGSPSSCKEWLNFDQLRDDQSAYLEGFKERFKSSHKMNFH